MIENERETERDWMERERERENENLYFVCEWVFGEKEKRERVNISSEDVRKEGKSRWEVPRVNDVG